VRWRGIATAALLASCEAPQAVSEDSPAAPVEVAAPKRDTDAAPTDAAAARAWLLAFAYRTWPPQTELRATGEHGGERLFFNNLLAASWQAKATEHPIGAAAVRELYSSDLRTLKGFALMVKTGPSGTVGEGWFWFEMFGTTEDATTTVAEHGARVCVGCHAHAVDFVHSPDTPRADPQPLL
jgi:hypothetical protein